MKRVRAGERAGSEASRLLPGAGRRRFEGILRHAQRERREILFGAVGELGRRFGARLYDDEQLPAAEGVVCRFGERYLELARIRVKGRRLAGLFDEPDFRQLPVALPAGLRNALLRYSPQFSRMFVEKLMTYAVGRGLEYTDMPTVRAISRDAQQQGHRFSAYVLGVVRSAQFQMRVKVVEKGNATN